MEVTLLTKEQIFGENKSKIFDEYGTKAAMTDFAILLGGAANGWNYYRDNKSLEGRTGWYWTSSDDKANDVSVVIHDGDRYFDSVIYRSTGARPALPYSSIQSISSNVVRGCDGILEVEYSEYPQRATAKILQIELENAYQNNEMSIKKTGKTYTTDSRKCYEYGKKFNAQKHEEFESKGKKDVRIKANSFYDGSEFTLSNGEKYKNGNYVWVEVLPIKWLVDIEKDIALSEKILFAGILFDIKKRYDGNFKETFMYNYLNTIFIKDIQVQQKQVQPKEIKISVIKEKSERELILEKLEKDKQKILSLRRNLVNKR